MIKRHLEPVLLERLRHFPAVAIVGPRQCGKTTLAKTFQGVYFDLEQESERLRLDIEWNQLVSGNSLIVLDEAHVAPEIFPRLRGAIDDDRRRYGRFLILGSVSPSLMKAVSESLIGRLSVLELAPFSLREVPTELQDNRWLRGGFPDGGVMGDGQFPRWQLDYLGLLAQRDLPNWGLNAQPQTTTRLFRMLAVMHGQEWNASQIGKSLGLSYHTVNTYLDHLVEAFLVRRLNPFHANIRKRLTKRSKVYWCDTGLLHALLNVHDQQFLHAQPWVGASWEGYVIDQVLITLRHRDIPFQAFHLRTADQQEIDLVVEVNNQLWTIEVKLTSNPSIDDLARVGKTSDLIDADLRFLVCKEARLMHNANKFVCDLDGLLSYIEDL